MASIVVSGDTSGAITISAPATAGTNTLSLPANTGTAILDYSTPAYRNRIINGAMMIDQRNAGASVTPSSDGTYQLDRWQSTFTASSKFSVQQTPSATETGYATRVAAGFTNYLACTSTSAFSVTSTDKLGIQQNIEGLNISDLAWGTANAKAVTLSAWVYSSLTGTFGGSIRNNDSSRSYPFSYTISSANTWTYITVTISGDTTGTWLTTTGTGMRVMFSLGAGSSASGTAGTWASANYWSATGATSVVGTNGATFYITGVQLEKGSTATSFDYRPYGTELALCQRYYARMTAGALYTTFGSSVVSSATSVAGASIKLPVTMRASPTINYSNIRIYDGGGSPAITSIGNTWSSPDFWSADLGASGGGLTTGRAGMVQASNNSAAWVDASAEL